MPFVDKAIARRLRHSTAVSLAARSPQLQGLAGARAAGDFTCCWRKNQRRKYGMRATWQKKVQMKSNQTLSYHWWGLNWPVATPPICLLVTLEGSLTIKATGSPTIMARSLLPGHDSEWIQLHAKLLVVEDGSGLTRSVLAFWPSPKAICSPLGRRSLPRPQEA